MGVTVVTGPGEFPNGVPAPIEIVCIEVTKVYDSCFQTDILLATATVAPAISGTVVSGGCTVTGTSCTLISSTPAASPPNPPPPAVPLFQNLTFNVVVSGSVTVISSAGLSTGAFTVSQLKTVTLFAPSGVSTLCEITADCQITSISGNTVNINIDLCEVFKTVFLAQLLVPAYGFCTPSPCSVSPIVCPPVPPPQFPPDPPSYSAGGWPM